MRSVLYKIANQSFKMRFNSGNPLPTCSKCNRLIDKPFQCTLSDREIGSGKIKNMYSVYHYVGTPYFIIESKSGYASTYCSEYCMKKHNAIFTRK